MTTGWWIKASHKQKRPSRKTLQWDLLGLQGPVETSSALSMQELRRQIISASSQGLSPETVARAQQTKGAAHQSVRKAARSTRMRETRS